MNNRIRAASALFGVILFVAGCATGSYVAIPVDTARLLNPLPPSNVPVVDIANVDEIPRATFQSPPNYPPLLREKDVSGSVIVDFIVDETGMPRDIHAVRGTDNAFAIAATNAVAEWRFEPGIKGGRPVRTHLQVPLVFTVGPASRR